MKNKINQKDGFALLLVLFIIAAISLMLGMLVHIGGQRAFTAKRLSDNIKAMAYAEAGIDYAYSILANDFDLRNDPDAFQIDGTTTPFLSTDSSSDGSFSSTKDQLTKNISATTNPTSTESSYGDGSFSLTITPISNKYVIINSVGRVGNTIQTAEILINDENARTQGNLPNDYSNMEGFNYAILSGGTLDFSGCGVISSPAGHALFHSNNKMSLRGSVNALIDLSSSSTIQIKGNTTIVGTMTENAPHIPIPDIDLTPYYNWALEHGEVHNGFTTTSDITPNGGILWVNGDFHISAQANVYGSVIATGDINLSGQINIKPTTAAFSIVSRDGDIHITSSGTIEGLMYAKTGDLQHTSNGEIVGQIIINGNIRKAGNSDIMAGYSQKIPLSPGGLDSTTPTIAWPVISAWQK